jgi:hypothetical protein
LYPSFPASCLASVLLPQDEYPSIATMIFGSLMDTNFRHLSGKTNIAVVRIMLYILTNKKGGLKPPF